MSVWDDLLELVRRVGSRLVQEARATWSSGFCSPVGLVDVALAPLGGLVRECHVARARTAGASIKGVQSMLGHASAAMTLDRYGHLFGDELDAVAERMHAARADWMRTEGSNGGDRRSAH